MVWEIIGGFAAGLGALGVHGIYNQIRKETPDLPKRRKQRPTAQVIRRSDEVLYEEAQEEEKFKRELEKASRKTN